MTDPVFILGAPRSGTTLLLDLLSAHEALAWISEHLNREPENLALASRNRMYDWPLAGTFLFERRYAVNRLPMPVEPWTFWEHYLPGFRRAGDIPRPHLATDVTEADAERCRGAVAEICRRQHKNLLLSKYTDFPRIRLLRAVFPNAKFIYLSRDPKSVAVSYARRVEKGEFSEWKEKDVWRAALPGELRQRLDTLAPTPLNLCGILTRWFLDCTHEEYAELPKADRLHIRYAGLVATPEKTLGRISDFLGLPTCRRALRYIKLRDIREQNKRLKLDLDTKPLLDLQQAVHR